jgi:molybdopterin synthase catalytic subunit
MENQKIISSSELKNDQIIYFIQEDPIDIPSLITKMKDNKGGALSIFLGTTRDHFENKKVLKLFYEAHPTMATKKLKEIAEIAYEKYKLLKIAIIHRVGEVVSKMEKIKKIFKKIE